MKKMMKKLIAMAAALVMIVTLLPAMGVNAELTEFADFSLWREGSITIHKTTQDADNPLPGAGFTLYKIVSFKVDNKTGKIVVQNDENVHSELADGTDINTIDASDFTLPSSASAAAEKYGDKYPVYNAATTDQRLTDDNGDLVFPAPDTEEKITAGIYVAVESTLPTGTEGTSYYESVPFLISIPSTSGTDENGNIYGDGEEENAGLNWVYNITASPKNNEASGSKEITGVTDKNDNPVGSVDASGDAASALPGDTVKYVIRTTTPTKNTSFAVKDNLKHLEYDKDSLVVYDESNDPATVIASSNYDVSYVYKTDGDVNTPIIGFTVTFKDTWINANPATPIALEYTATVSEDAKIGTDDNTNEAIIQYDNNSNTLSDIPKVYTYGFVLTKVGENDSKLEEVQFDLYRGSVADENKMNEQPLTTGKDGILTYDGLAAGTYYLKEIKTQDGYTLLANPVKIVITANGDVTAATATMTVDNVKTVGKVTDVDDEETRFTFTIVNNKGFTLPSTGGMGTYLFTIGGIVIMAGAAFALIAMKKRA